MFGFQLISRCLGHTAKLGLAAGVGADLPSDCKVRPLVTAQHCFQHFLYQGQQQLLRFDIRMGTPTAFTPRQAQLLVRLCALSGLSQAWLTDVGVDVSGLIEGQLPTPRAWQLFEEDGRRTQVRSRVGHSCQQQPQLQR